jgi:hypothetical protein
LRRRRDVDFLALERAGRRAGRHAKALDLGEHVEQLFGKAIGEVFVFLVAAHVDERQHGDRRHGLLRGDGAQRRKRGPQGRVHQLVEGLRLWQILERELAERCQRSPFRKHLAARFSRRHRHEHLPAVTGGHHARDALSGGPK